MNRIKRQLRLHMDPWNDNVDIAYVETRDGIRYVAQPVEFTRLDHGMAIQAPSFTLEPEQAQELFNGLWQLGYRPKDGTGNSGHVAAIERHLEDMRTLVFKGDKDKK